MYIRTYVCTYVYAFEKQLALIMSCIYTCELCIELKYIYYLHMYVCMCTYIQGTHVHMYVCSHT